MEGFADGPQDDREGRRGGEAPFKIRGRGRNGGEGFIDGPQDDREGRGGEAPSKMMGRGRNGAESLSETPPQIKWRVKTPPE